MSYRSQLFPLSSTRERFNRGSSQTASGEMPESSRNLVVLRPRSDENSSTLDNLVSCRPTRSKAMGLALAFGVGVSFWAGIAVMVARVWK